MTDMTVFVETASTSSASTARTKGREASGSNGAEKFSAALDDATAAVEGSKQQLHALKKEAAAAERQLRKDEHEAEVEARKNELDDPTEGQEVAGSDDTVAGEKNHANGAEKAAGPTPSEHSAVVAGLPSTAAQAAVEHSADGLANAAVKTGATTTPEASTVDPEAGQVPAARETSASAAVAIGQSTSIENGTSALVATTISADISVNSTTQAQAGSGEGTGATTADAATVAVRTVATTGVGEADTTDAAAPTGAAVLDETAEQTTASTDLNGKDTDKDGTRQGADRSEAAVPGNRGADKATGLERAAIVAGEHGSEGRANALAAHASKAIDGTTAEPGGEAAHTASVRGEASASAGSNTQSTQATTIGTSANANVALHPDRSAAGSLGAHIRGVWTQERIDQVALQFTARLKLSQAAGGASVHLQLRPKELGAVDVSLNVSNGNVTATVTTERADTGRMLAQHGDELRRALASQGLNIDGFAVDVRSGDSGNQNNNEARAQGALHGTASFAGDLDGSAAEGLVATQIDAWHSGQVSVLA